MRASTYELVLPLIGEDEQEIEGKRVLINGLYGSVDVVDKDVAAKLFGDDPDGLDAPIKERLALRGHLTRKSPEEEMADVKLLGTVYYKIFARAEMSVAILPTYDCNFRCPYCFESHRLSRGQEWLSRKMPPEMVDAIFDALQKQRDQGRRLTSCILYGGEPLMKGNEDVVRNICEHARHMEMRIEAVTNGYDLEDYLDLLEEFEFNRLQVTVDGVGEQNDCRRRHKDGVPTYERIMANIQLALERGIDVQLRVNVNRGNIDGIPNLIDDLVARDLTKPEEENDDDNNNDNENDNAGEKRGNFSYYFKAVSEDPSSPTRVSEQEVLEAIVASGISPYQALRLQSQYGMALRNLADMAPKNSYPICQTAYCGAESGALVIDPDGKIHTCWDMVGLDGECVGYVDEGDGAFAYNFNKARWRIRCSDKMEACTTCPYVFMCRGGCGSDAKRRTGSPFSEECGEFKEMFSYAASHALARRWKNMSKDELSVSLYGPLSRMAPEEREELMTTTSGKKGHRSIPADGAGQ